MNETELKNKLQKILIPKGFTVKIAGSTWQRNGLPDLLHIHKESGKVIWIELKVDDNPSTPVQLSCQNEINRKGGIAITLRFRNELNRVQLSRSVIKRDSFTWNEFNYYRLLEFCEVS